MSTTNQLFDPFSIPMRSLDDAQIIVREIEALLTKRNLSLRPPPPCRLFAVAVAATAAYGRGTTKLWPTGGSRQRRSCSDGLLFVDFNSTLMTWA